jgi:hypothetical protein
MRHSPPIILCVALLTWTACQRVQAPATKLAFGHKVRVLQIGTMFFSAGKPALMVKYETKTSFDDVQALRQEAKELAEQLRSTLDRSGDDAAILSANEPAGNAIISKTRGDNFIVEKKSGGTWKLNE